MSQQPGADADHNTSSPRGQKNLPEDLWGHALELLVHRDPHGRPQVPARPRPRCDPKPSSNTVSMATFRQINHAFDEVFWDVTTTATRMETTFTSCQRQKNFKVQNTPTKRFRGPIESRTHSFSLTLTVLIQSPSLDEGYLDVQRTDPRPEPSSALLTLLLSQSSISVLLVTCDNPGEINICLFSHSFNWLRPHRLVEQL